MAKNIKPRATDYSQWYLDVIKAAKLADYTPVKGSMAMSTFANLLSPPRMKSDVCPFANSKVLNGAP